MHLVLKRFNNLSLSTIIHYPRVLHKVELVKFLEAVRRHT